MRWYFPHPWCILFFRNGYYLRLCEFTFVNSESSSASERARTPPLCEDARGSHAWIRSVDHAFKVEGSRLPSGSPQRLQVDLHTRLNQLIMSAQALVILGTTFPLA